MAKCEICGETARSGQSRCISCRRRGQCETCLGPVSTGQTLCTNCRSKPIKAASDAEIEGPRTPKVEFVPTSGRDGQAKPAVTRSPESPEARGAEDSLHELNKNLRSLLEMQATQNAYAKKSAEAAQGILAFLVLSAIGAFLLWFSVAVLIPTI